MRLTFKRKNLICRADGDNNEVYKASKRINYSERQKAHQDFVESEMGKSFMAIASTNQVPYQPVYTEYCLFGEWHPLKRGADIQRYKDGGYKLR